MTATDVFYELHRKNQGNVYAQYTLSPWDRANQITRGENARLELHFGNLDNLTVSGSRTVESGTLEQYDLVTIENGATLTVNGTLSATQIDNNGTLDNNGVVSIQAGYTDNLRNFGDFAGGFATVETLNSTQKYREQIPSDADVNSIVLGVEPSQTLQDRDIPGIWGLVNNVSDTRPSALSDSRIEIELVVLAEFAEYADHTALENDLLV